jgi:hypothetical protein
MAKKIDIKFDLDTKSVQIAGQDTMKLTQQVRLLKAELASGKYSQEEFEILSKTLGDVEDQMAKTKARSGDLFTSLQLIPGPIGEIASKFNGAIALLKTFSSFSLQDLSFQFKETIDDVKQIGEFLGKATGITKLYTILNAALARSFVAVGVGEQAAAAGARAFSAALLATGIGALVVGLGLAVSALMDFIDTSDDAAAAQERLGKEIASVNMLLDMDLADAARRQKVRIAQLKRDGASEKEIRDQGLQDLQENLKLTEQALQENRDLESKVLKTGQGELKDVYAQQTALEEKRAQLLTDIRVGEIDNQTQTNKELESQRQKNLQDAKAAADKEAQEERRKQDELKKIQEDAAAIQLEARLSLLDETDRAIEERTMRFEADKKKLIAAGYTDLTLLEQEFSADISAIDKKAKDDRLAKEKEHLDEVKAARKADQDSYFELLQESYDVESQKLLERLGQSQEYFTKQKELDTQYQTDLQFGRERDLINQSQYTQGTADLTNARNELSTQETNARLQDLELVANALNAFSQLAGENTKIGKALAIATTTIDTYIGAQKAFNSQLTLTPDSPIRAAIAAASAVIAGLARVRSIVQTKIPNSTLSTSTSTPQAQAPQPIQVVARRSQGGFVFGNGGSITDSIPTMLSDGEFVMNAKSSALFSPMLSAMNNMGNLPNTALPISSGNQSLVDVVNQSMNSRPIRTYVTAQDMSNQQQFDRTIKSRSLI